MAVQEQATWQTRGLDLLAGLSVAGLLVPEAVAYAGIAGLAPGRALMAGVVGGLVYAMVGRSRFAVVSATSSSASILAAALGSMAVAPTLPGTVTADALATAMTLMVGIMFTVLALFRMGGLAGFVSRPVLRGFALGLATTIIIRQLPHLVHVAVPGSTIGQVLAGLATHRAQWHWPSAALGLGALAALVMLRRVAGLPATLIVMAAGIAAGSFGPLAHSGIALVGPTPIAMPRLTLPTDLAVWSRIAQLAAPLTLIIFAESWGTIRGLALAHGDTVSSNRELAAIGLANGAAALAQGMPIGAGFSIGSANAAAGARSRLSVAVASVATLALVLFAGPLIARIPEPVLAAVVIAALIHALNPAPIARLFVLQRDQWIAVAAMTGVLLLGVLAGMLLAIALSLAQLLYRWSHPVTSELGRIGTGHDFVDLSRHDDAARVLGVAIFRPNAPLFFANAETVLQTIGRAVRASGAQVLVLSLEESDDLDATALDALGEFAEDLHASGCRLILARAHDRVRDVLTAAGLGNLADNATFSVADAARRAISA
ncbi:SulP family inorganic anion transporter [Novosphingobium sp.]|uniref:SulP family inorganic anion transporter n=1 Tax=Novosphingobium sp. TaxID=1874826 RepID=UPI003342D90A